MVVKEEIRKVVSKGKAAGVLRLVFHDAGTFEKVDNSGICFVKKEGLIMCSMFDDKFEGCVGFCFIGR